MKPLPVPPLQATLDRYLTAVRPLLDERAYSATQRLVQEFARTDGPTCQQELQRFAAAESAAGRSWLSQAWLSGYLTGRTPLPLTSNVLFRINWETGGEGIDRAADIVHRFASVHLTYLRGETAPEISPRGEELVMDQWQVLAGGLRHPRAGQDESRPGRPGAAQREIGVLWKGRYVAVPISDEAGQPLSRPVLADALRRVTDLPGTDRDHFTDVSYLGSERAAEHLDTLLADPDNACTYARLTDAVFCVHLLEEPSEEEAHQRRCAFAPGHAWAYKPLTYQVGLADHFVAVHLEHSTIDGATLKTIIERAQQVRPNDAQGPVAQLQTLDWAAPDGMRAALDREVTSYRHQAEAHRVRIVRVPDAAQAASAGKISHDAVQQFIMVYAQLAAFRRVRSTYEAVDMREYQAGRTECLRPNTGAAVSLARALLAGDATVDDVHVALAAHKDWVRACKSGQGIDRHLLGLRLMAQRLGMAPGLFGDEGYRRLTTDFLSTTSVGDQKHVVRCSFAPTSPEGIGVYYTPTPAQYEFCMNYHQDHTQSVDEFINALYAGASGLAEVLGRVG